MQLHIPIIRYQYLIALGALAIAAIAPKDHQMLAMLIVGATSFLWGIIESATDEICEDVVVTVVQITQGDIDAELEWKATND